MIATASDFRLMVTGKAKISLNELNFGSSVFTGNVAMLKHCLGSANSEQVLYSGKMYSAEEALELGLIDRVTSGEDLAHKAFKAAKDLALKDTTAFKSIKNLLLGPVAEEMLKREGHSIREFVDIWYSENTWKNLQLIKIRTED
jgi:3,2-trans-enoyl-CoA isomerase